MKHKISFLIITLLTTACGVQVKNKNSEQPVTVQALAHPDYLIDGPVVLDEDLTLEVNRLILTKDAVITTETHKLTIIAEEIVSDGAIIRNFAEGARASLEQNGRSGGGIEIKATIGRGHLQVEMRGESGGNGKNGRIMSGLGGQLTGLGCLGTSGGTGGNAGTLQAEIADMTRMNLTWKNEEGSLGVAGTPFSAGPTDPNAKHPPCDLRVKGINGQPGNKGQICLKFGDQESFQCN